MPVRRKLTKLLLSVALAGLPLAADGLEYRSVAEQGAALYAAPQPQSKKLFLFSRYTPLELVFANRQWAKVRDISGGMGWIEARQLAELRTVQVTAARAEIRARAEDTAPAVFAVERDVVLELVEPPAGGWARVRHRDGKSGFISIKNIWGL
ncbi:MAG: SH3 domain-containing protein [Chitinivorax sp.]